MIPTNGVSLFIFHHLFSLYILINIASSTTQPGSIQATEKPQAQPNVETPPWLTATGDIDERKTREFGNPFQNLVTSHVPSSTASHPADVSKQAAHLEQQAPWLSKSQQIAVTPAAETTGPASQPGLPPWARSQQQTVDRSKFPSQPNTAPGGRKQVTDVEQPPWARTQPQERQIEKPQVLFQSESSSQVIGSPPWSKGQSSQASQKKTEAPWKTASSTHNRPLQRVDAKSAPPWASQGKAQATVPPWGKGKADSKFEAKAAASSAPWVKSKGSSSADRSPPKTPWEAKRQSELASKSSSTSSKKAKYDPFERDEMSKRDDGDVIDKRLAEINKKMAAMDRKIKEYEEKEQRRKGGRDRSRSRSRERDRRRRSRSRERGSRRERSRDREDRYRERDRRRERSKSPRSRPSPFGMRRDMLEGTVPDESRYDL